MEIDVKYCYEHLRDNFQQEHSVMIQTKPYKYEQNASVSLVGSVLLISGFLCCPIMCLRSEFHVLMFVTISA